LDGHAQRRVNASDHARSDNRFAKRTKAMSAFCNRWAAARCAIGLWGGTDDAQLAMLLAEHLGSDFWARVACVGELETTNAAEPPMANDAVGHPAHYNAGSIEAIDVIDDWQLGFCDGNVVKYLCRSKHAGEQLSDLRKARWYLDRLITKLERKTS
jgi:hypothetical protein